MNINKKKITFGSYPFISVIFSTSLSIILLGFFIALYLFSKSLTNIIRENIEVQVFLENNLSNSEINGIQKMLSSKYYIQKNKESIKLITKKEATNKFIKETGEDFTEFLGENPLRDVIILKINPQFQSLESLNKIKSDIETLRGVFEVSFIESLVQEINDNLTKIGYIIIGTTIALILFVIMLINNTIKIALFSQRFLIRSMQLVGATDTFIKAPFLKRSTIYGLIASIFSIIVLYSIINYGFKKIDGLKELISDEMLILLFTFMAISGIILSFLSTYFSINKYLKTSLDELY